MKWVALAVVFLSAAVLLAIAPVAFGPLPRATPTITASQEALAEAALTRVAPTPVPGTQPLPTLTPTVPSFIPTQAASAA